MVPRMQIMDLSPKKREQNQSEEDLKPQTRSRMTVSPAVLKKWNRITNIESLLIIRTIVYRLVLE